MVGRGSWVAGVLGRGSWVGAVLYCTVDRRYRDNHGTRTRAPSQLTALPGELPTPPKAPGDGIAMRVWRSANQPERGREEISTRTGRSVRQQLLGRGSWDLEVPGLGYWYVCTQVSSSSTCRCSFEGHRRTTNQTPSRYFTACRRITDGRDVDGYDVIRRRNGPPTCDLETDATRPPSKLLLRLLICRRSGASSARLGSHHLILSQISRISPRA